MECLRRLSDALAESSTTTSASMCSKDRKTLVKHAVDFMHERLNEPLTAVELFKNSRQATDRSAELSARHLVWDRSHTFE